jgi:hypothetical protein
MSLTSCPADKASHSAPSGVHTTKPEFFRAKNFGKSCSVRVNHPVTARHCCNRRLKLKLSCTSRIQLQQQLAHILELRLDGHHDDRQCSG